MGFSLLGEKVFWEVRQSIRTSMRNLESVAQEMAELLHNYVIITYIRTYVITKFLLRNLSGQSIRTSTRNLEAVAQKMAELLHNYVIITYIRNYNFFS